MSYSIVRSRYASVPLNPVASFAQARCDAPQTFSHRNLFFFFPCRSRRATAPRGRQAAAQGHLCVAVPGSGVTRVPRGEPHRGVRATAPATCAETETRPRRRGGCRWRRRWRTRDQGREEEAECSFAAATTAADCSRETPHRSRGTRGATAARRDGRLGRAQRALVGRGGESAGPLPPRRTIASPERKSPPPPPPRR